MGQLTCVYATLSKEMVRNWVLILSAGIATYSLDAMNLSPCGYRLHVKAGIDPRVINQRFAKSIGDQRFHAVERVTQRLKERSDWWRGTIFTPDLMMPFKDKELVVLDTIGVGSESNIYLVKTSEGLRAAKVYRRDKVHSLPDEVEQLNHLNENGVPVIVPIDSDFKNGILLFPYHEGFDVRNAHANAAILGLTSSEEGIMYAKAIQVREKVRAYFEKFPERPRFMPEDYNMVYDVNTRDVVLVDRQ